MIESLLRWWGSLTPRDRRVLGIGVGVVAVALLYLLAFEPAHQGRVRLEKELPALRGQLAQMDALSAEVRRFAGQATQGADSPQQLRSQLEASIAAAGLKGSLSQLTLSGDLIDLRFKAVPFAAWLAWFDGALRETRLRAVDIAIERDAGPGTVSARLTLEAQKSGP